MFITSHEHLKQYASPHRLWQGIPSIERTRGERIFVSFYSGMDTERNGNYGVARSISRLGYRPEPTV